MPKIEYNQREKILSIRFAETRSVDSDVKDNVVMDYDENGHLVNLDILEVNLEDLIRLSGKKVTVK